MSIMGFFKEYEYLSNFYPASVEMDGDVYPSVEHAYQAAKTFDLSLRRFIKQQDTPGKAKRAGGKITLIPDWDIIKLEVMHDLLIQKFAQEPFRTKLINTGDAYLEETNWWKDKFWGVCNGIGENHLGKLLMKIRKDLQEISK